MNPVNVPLSVYMSWLSNLSLMVILRLAAVSRLSYKPHYFSHWKSFWIATPGFEEVDNFNEFLIVFITTWHQSKRWVPALNIRWQQHFPSWCPSREFSPLWQFTNFWPQIMTDHHKNSVTERCLHNLCVTLAKLPCSDMLTWRRSHFVVK